jgi:hypothetical protein
MRTDMWKLMVLAVFAILVVVFIYWGDLTRKQGIEKFVDVPAEVQNSARVPYEFDNYDFPPSIFEAALWNAYDKSPLVLCQIIPALGSKECRVGEIEIIKYKFPVSLARLPNGKTAAVFNDGRIYLKDRLIDKLWQGPIKNSFPDRTIPLRVITLNPEADRLVGVGYDNRVYIKKKDPNANVSIETEWEQIPGLADVIYLLYEQDQTTGKYNYIIINRIGRVVLVPVDRPTTRPTPVGNIQDRVLKLIYDPEGYMMALDINFNLRSFDKKDWKTSQLSQPRRRNKMSVLDVLYDKDQLMFGLVIVKETGMTEVMKQEDAHFMAPFVPLDLNKYVDSNLDMRLTERTIIQTKLGVVPGQGLLEEEALDEDVNMAYQRQLLEDKKRLRDFCANRALRTDANYKNYDVLKAIDDNATKIEKLTSAIQDLISFDPDQKAIKESVLGIDIIKSVPSGNPTPGPTPT